MRRDTIKLVVDSATFVEDRSTRMALAAVMTPPLLCLLCCRFVLENSGVAEPQNIRDKFSEAVQEGNPLASRLKLDTMITVVDSATFGKDYSTRTAVAARPDLGEGGSR